MTNNFTIFVALIDSKDEHCKGHLVSLPAANTNWNYLPAVVYRYGRPYTSITCNIA